MTNFTAVSTQVLGRPFSLQGHLTHYVRNPSTADLPPLLSSSDHLDPEASFASMTLVSRLCVFAVLSVAIKASDSRGGNFSNKNYMLGARDVAPLVERSPRVYEVLSYIIQTT